MSRNSSRILAGGALFAAAVLLIASPADGRAQIHESERHTFRVDTVANGLEHPWSVAFLPNGDILVTERPGRLRIIRDGRLLPEPVAGVPQVRVAGQGGLLDVAPHPDFATNRLIYLSYSKPDGNRGTTAVVRGRFENDRLVDVEEIFEAQAWSTGNNHWGSRLAFDGNGYLFISVGDRQAPPSGDLYAHPAQDLGNHQGTIIRLHDDGRVPTDNPFVNTTGALPEIWSYGHRNPQALIVHPVTGDVWATEHGPQGGDELNLILPGRNYGWPVIGYGVNYGPGAPIHETTSHEGMEQPVHFWVPSIAPAGLAVYTGDAFPNWRGNFFAGGMARPDGGGIARLSMDGNRVVSTETLLIGTRVRDVRQGPDGSLYVVVNHRGGESTPILRLRPASGN